MGLCRAAAEYARSVRGICCRSLSDELIVLSFLVFVDELHCSRGTVILSHSEALIQYPRFAAVSAVHHDKTTASVDNMLNHLDSEALSLQDSKSERT